MAEASDRVPSDDAVCLAVCVGWRMAELYDAKDLPGPPASDRTGRLPEHLPGLGEMSAHERAAALVAHLAADVASLGRALRIKHMPSAGPVLAVLRSPAHSRDDMRASVLDLYLQVRNTVAGSNASAAVALGLGRMLADTTLLPVAGDSQTLREQFGEYRLANAYGWLDDLGVRLPARSAAVVRATLAQWQEWVQAPDTDADAATIRALRQQGDVWRRLLTGEQSPDQLLDRQAYIGAAAKLLAAGRRMGLHYLWKWSWSILLAAVAAGVVVWAALAYAPGTASRITTVALSAGGFVGLSWLGVRATLGRAIRQAESALWEAEVTAAAAKAAATTPEHQPAGHVTG